MLLPGFLRDACRLYSFWCDFFFFSASALTLCSPSGVGGGSGNCDTFGLCRNLEWQHANELECPKIVARSILPRSFQKKLCDHGFIYFRCVFLGRLLWNPPVPTLKKRLRTEGKRGRCGCGLQLCVSPLTFDSGLLPNTCCTLVPLQLKGFGRL